MAQYYISENGVRHGPFEVAQLAGTLRPDSYVWCEGMDTWQRADSVSELAEILLSNPSPGYEYDPYQQQNAYNPPTQMQYAGGGYYRRGNPGMGIASMVLGIVSVLIFCIWFLSIPCALIGIILGGVSLKDPASKPFSIAGIICSISSLVLLALIVLIAVAARPR